MSRASSTVLPRTMYSLILTRRADVASAPAASCAQAVFITAISTSACGARRKMARNARPLLSKSCIAMHSVPCVKTGLVPAATVQRASRQSRYGFRPQPRVYNFCLLLDVLAGPRPRVVRKTS
ncbi:hypothetical protein D3C78_1216950 [compost metagenome]